MPSDRHPSLHLFRDSCSPWESKVNPGTRGSKWDGCKRERLAMVSGAWEVVLWAPSYFFFSTPLSVCYAMLCWVTSVVSGSVWPHRRQPTSLPRPWDSPGKNTGVGCHFLLQCMKVKRESEVYQSCPTLSDPMDCSLPGSSVHGIFQARVLEWGAIAFSALIYRLNLNGSPFNTIYVVLEARILKWVPIPFSSGPHFVHFWMLSNCGVGEDSWESLEQQSDQPLNPKGNQP